MGRTMLHWIGKQTGLNNQELLSRNYRL